MKTKQEEINERWKPEEGELYYVADAYCNAVESSFANDNIDDIYYDAFNMFQTREEAEKASKYQLIFRKLYSFSKRNNGEFGYGYWIEIVLLEDVFIFRNIFKTNSGKIRFSSEEIAKKAIEHIGEEDMKWYLTFKA